MLGAKKYLEPKESLASKRSLASKNFKSPGLSKYQFEHRANDKEIQELFRNLNMYQEVQEVLSLPYQGEKLIKKLNNTEKQVKT